MTNHTVNKRRKDQILVVEDNSDQWVLTERSLKDRFPEVEPIWKSTAEEALFHLEKQLECEQKLPVLMLLDLYLPEREQGWALLQIVKAHYVYQTIPVIVLSYSDQKADIDRSYDLQSNAYMVKPIGDQNWLDEMEKLRRYWWDTSTIITK